MNAVLSADGHEHGHGDCGARRDGEGLRRDPVSHDIAADADSWTILSIQSGSDPSAVAALHLAAMEPDSNFEPGVTRFPPVRSPL